MSRREHRYDAWLRRNPPHPGGMIRDGCMGAMSVAEAARELGVSAPALSRVLNGHAGISVALALKLEAAGWGTAEAWVGLQGNYDLVRERRRRGQWPGGASYHKDSGVKAEAA